ncbi:MAG: hypothetical protein IPK72_20990 [Candidatus Eisenbacteria bacterium]|nr:hypothetical protein [Candidatus Eisenbacteria bacterium]
MATVFLVASVSLLSPAQTAWEMRVWNARQGHALAYDSARGRTVLFGGVEVSSYVSDTWEWDGSNWTRQNPAVSPPARSGHALAYDSARGRTVLFGGFYAVAGNGSYLSDTWEWDPGPPGRR